jgi:hypothetical protein
MTIDLEWLEDGTTAKPTETYAFAFTDANDMASKVRQFLTSGNPGDADPGRFPGLGGVWTVTAEQVGNVVRVTDISGVNQTHTIDLITFLNEEGVGGSEAGVSDHDFVTPSYEDPYIAAAMPLLANELPTDGTAANCLFSSITDLVTAEGTGALEIEFDIQSNRMDLYIEIRDHEDTIVSYIYYEYTTPPGLGRYECDKRYAFSRVAGWYSRTGPSDGGPDPGEVADWDGAVAAAMNLSASQGGQ